MSYDEAGGTKEDYIPVVDPTTDRSADEVNSVFYVATAMSNTNVNAALTVQGGFAVGPVVPVSHRASWGSSPTLAPVVNCIQTGVLEITWPSSILNGVGQNCVVNFQRALAAFSSPNEWGFVSAVVQNSNQIIVYCRNQAGTLYPFAANARIEVVVY